MSLDRRLQILLDEGRYSRISAIAEREKRSVASVIREAIDMRTGIDPDARTAAWLAINSADLMPVPSPDELHVELEALRGRQFGEDHSSLGPGSSS